jgi:hypothetical protein
LFVLLLVRWAFAMIVVGAVAISGRNGSFS